MSLHGNQGIVIREGIYCRQSHLRKHAPDVTTSQLQLLNLHIALDARLDRQPGLRISDWSAPLMLVLAAHDLITELAARDTRFAASIGIDHGTALEVLEFILPLDVASAFGLSLPLGEFVVQRLGAAPLALREGILFDLEPQVQHHVVPRRLVRVRLLDVRQQLLVFELGIRQEVVLPRFGFREQAVLLRELVLAGIAHLAFQRFVPFPVDLETAAFAAFLVRYGVVDVGLVKTRLLVSHLFDQLCSFPFFESHARGFVFLVGRMEGSVEGIIILGQESALGVCHPAEVVLDVVLKLLGGLNPCVCRYGILGRLARITLARLDRLSARADFIVWSFLACDKAGRGLVRQWFLSELLASQRFGLETCFFL